MTILFCLTIVSSELWIPAEQLQQLEQLGKAFAGSGHDGSTDGLLG